MNKREALVAGLLSAVLVALLVPFARVGVDPHHDGIMLKPALDVASGQVLFRDTFMQYGALTCYIQAVALWIQPTLLNLKMLTVAAYAVTLFVLYAAWRLILPRSLTVLSGALFILFIPWFEKTWLNTYWILVPWSSVLAMMFQAIGLYALFQVIRGVNAVRWAVGLGLACAGVFWCRQPVGLVMGGSLAAIWLALGWTGWSPGEFSKRKIVVGFWGGVVAITVPLLAGIVFSGAQAEWWYQNYTWPRKWAQGSVTISWQDFTTGFVHPAAGAQLLWLLLALAAPGVVKRFRPGLSVSGITVYFICLGAILAWHHEWTLGALALREGGWTALLPLIVLGSAVVAGQRALARPATPRTTEYFLVAAWSVFALGSLLQYYPLSDAWHVLWSLAPAFGLVVFVFWRCTAWRPPVVAGILAAAFLPAVGLKVQAARPFLAEPRVTLEQPAVLRGMRVPPQQAQGFRQITELVERIERQRPGMPSVLIGNDALFLCFMGNLTNPTPYFVTWPQLAPDEANQIRWSYISRVRPLLFLHQANWKATDDFYARAGYVPVLFLSAESLEIAVPGELARTMGLAAYAAGPEKRVGQ